MRYRGLKRADAKRYLVSLANDTPMQLNELLYESGSGTISIEPEVDELVKRLDALRHEFPEFISKKSSHAKAFELDASIMVHSALINADLEMLADPDFWMWLAVAKLDPIIRWRYGSTSSVAHLNNYGVNGLTENFAFRLWLRGEIGFSDDNPDDHYELARIPDLDFWRSHLFRQSYSHARQVARAVVMLQAGKLATGPLSTPEIRSLAKELKRLRANVVFEFLSLDQALQLILEQASRAVERSAAGEFSKT